MSESNISGNLFDLKILKRLLVFCRPYMKVFYILIILTLSLSVFIIYHSLLFITVQIDPM